MTSLFAVVFLAIQQPTVSVHSDAIHAKLLVAELAKQSKIDIACDPILAKEPVVCDFESAPVEEVLSHLATVVGGEWRQVGSQRRLSRSASLSARFERIEREFFASKIAANLDSRMKEIRQLPELAEAEANRFANQTRLQTESQAAMNAELLYIQNFHPVAVATYKLLNSIGARRISSIGIDQRVVFSDFPNNMQEKLPVASTSIIRQLLQEAEMMQLAKVKFKVVEGRARFGGIPDILSGDPQRYRKSLLVLQVNKSNRMAITLTCWDQDNKRIAVFIGSLPDSSTARMVSPSHKGDHVEFSREAKELAALQSRAGVQQGGGGGIVDKNGKTHWFSSYVSFAEAEGKPIENGYGELLQDPVAIDPIGLVFGKATRQLAKKLKKLLIASAGDNTIFGISQAIHIQRIVTETDILEYLEQSYVPEPSRVPISIVNREGKWLTIQSMFPNRTLKTRYNRVAAKGILATLRQSGCLSVYDGIGYISKNPYNPSIFSPDMILFQNSVTNAESQAPGYLFTDALPVLRDLGPTMLAASVNRPLQFNRLNPAIQGMIAQLVFSKEMALQMEDHQMGDPSLNGKDPTEVFPNGIPENAILEIGVKEEAAVLARSSKGYYFQLSMYQLATELEKGNLRSVSPGTTEKPREYIAFAPIFIKSYEIKLHLGKRTLLSVGSRGATRMPGSQETKIDSLPPGHLAALAEARKIFAPDPG